MKIIAMIGIGVLSFLILFLLTFATGFCKTSYTVLGNKYNSSYTDYRFTTTKSFLVSCVEVAAAVAVYYYITSAASPITVIGILAIILIPIESVIGFLIGKEEKKEAKKTPKKDDDNDDDIKVSACVLMTLNVLISCVFITLTLSSIGLIK